MSIFDHIEAWSNALAALGYDLDALAVLENEVRYIAGWLCGREARAVRAPESEVGV